MDIQNILINLNIQMFKKIYITIFGNLNISNIRAQKVDLGARIYIFLASPFWISMVQLFNLKPNFRVFTNFQRYTIIQTKILLNWLEYYIFKHVKAVKFHPPFTSMRSFWFFSLKKKYIYIPCNSLFKNWTIGSCIFNPFYWNYSTKTYLTKLILKKV